MIYGIAGHGKGEVDHVGGIAKTTTRREIARGVVMQVTCAIYNKKHFWNNTDPSYHRAEISEDLDLAHQQARKNVFPTIDVSSTFQIIVFRPNPDTFYTATCIFICQQCVTINYDSCNLFKPYELKTGVLISKFLRSKMAVKSFEVCGDEADSSDFLYQTQLWQLLLSKNPEIEVFYSN